MSVSNGPAQASTSNGGASMLTAEASTSSSALAPATTTTSDNPNMHFDTQTGKWIFENPDTGEELEWNIVANAWLPVVDDEVLAAQQAAYAVEGVDESTPAATLLARDRRKKRKAGDDGEARPSKKAARQKPGPRNTAVFVQRLPPDATLEEVNEVFSKAGFVLPDADGKPKIKLYTDKLTGLPNGDGLVVFLKEESVPLAISLLDDSPLRLGEKDSMRVAKAEWTHKAETSADGKGETAANDAAPHKRKGKPDGQAQKMQKRAEKLLRDAADYDPSYNEEDSGLAVVTKEAAPKPIEGGRVVVLQHIFTLQELEEDASLLLELKEDVREECENLGKVTSIVLYDKEPAGVVTIKFADPIAAQACIAKNHNRFFGGRQLKAWLYDGKTRYKKSGGIESTILEGESGEAAERRRLEEFGRWLETDPA